MRVPYSYILVVAFFVSGVGSGVGQEFTLADDVGPGGAEVASAATHVPPAATSPSRLAPEAALMVYLRHAQLQAETLASYSDITTVDAELPDSAQRGRLRLRRVFAAPRSLTFQALDFAGDSFIKTNVIARLLQSEVDHVQKGEGPQIAITDANYKFTFKGMEDFDGRMLYAYAVKPHKKRPGLFKGRIFIDPADGSLTRAEGTLVKSPSIFVKKIRFVQDYNEVSGFSLPIHIHSVAETRIAGRAIVDVVHANYQTHAFSDTQTTAVAR